MEGHVARQPASSLFWGSFCGPRMALTMKQDKTVSPLAEGEKTFRQYAKTYLNKIGTGFVSLLKGMWLTMGYLVDPRKVVTQQYPENRQSLKMMDRFRGGVVMIHDENDENRCTGCSLCERACPNGSISVLTTKNLAGKKVLAQYIYRLSQCTFCNLCIEACPFGAIEMGKEFELAVYDREQLTQILNKKEGQG